VRRRVILVVVVLVTAAEFAVVARRRGSIFGVNTVVCCRRGHLFTTFWIPGGSLKAIRLGWWRLQRCPAGRHWSLVTPVRVSALTAEERQLASHLHDIRVP
jgi:hypothetical protein